MCGISDEDQQYQISVGNKKVEERDADRQTSLE